MLILASHASAQFHANSKSNAEAQESNPETVLDKVQYRITYASKFVSDTTKIDSLGGYEYSDDEMRLDIGQSVSEFYSARRPIFDKWMNEQVARGNRDFTQP